VERKFEFSEYACPDGFMSAIFEFSGCGTHWPVHVRLSGAAPSTKSVGVLVGGVAVSARA